MAARSEAAVSHWVTGCSPTPGIVAVRADFNGNAKIWRRVDGQLVYKEERFPNWFLTTDPSLLKGVRARRARATGHNCPPASLWHGDDLLLVEFAEPSKGAYNHLLLARSLDEIKPTVFTNWNRRFGEYATGWRELADEIAIWSPNEQFLLITGNTLFQGLEYDDLVRLQFDLETTGLDRETDRIFMISMSDSTGWRTCLDVGTMTEAELIARFVELVRERDPDVIENHNIFEFDLQFVIRSARALDVPLPLGRDGSFPFLGPDSFRVSNRSEPFMRCTIAGRQILDTQHAVKRRAANGRDFRRHGLKDAARFLGIAKQDREYVPGAEIWQTFQTDPDRVRRYAGDDVEEVDGLSRNLLRMPFALTSIVPRTFERLVTENFSRDLAEPMIVRAHLHEGQSLPARKRPTGPVGPEPSWDSSVRHHLYMTGVVDNVVTLRALALIARIGESLHESPCGDRLGVVPRLLTRLLHDADEAVERGLAPRGAANRLLANRIMGHMHFEDGLLSDPPFAKRVDRLVREVMERVGDKVQQYGGTLIERDGDTLTVCFPSLIDSELKMGLRAWLSPELPGNVELEFLSMFDRVYVHGERSRVGLTADGTVLFLARGLQTGPQERFGERFVHAAAALVLAGDAEGLHNLHQTAVARLRSREVWPEDLSLRVALRRTPHEYLRLNQKQEPYEVLLAAGVEHWPAGYRVRYFRDASGAFRILNDGSPADPADVDVDYYVQRLQHIYAHLFARAFEPDDFKQIFCLSNDGCPAGAQPRPWGQIKTIHTHR